MRTPCERICPRVFGIGGSTESGFTNSSSKVPTNPSLCASVSPSGVPVGPNERLSERQELRGAAPLTHLHLLGVGARWSVFPTRVHARADPGPRPASFYEFWTSVLAPSRRQHHPQENTAPREYWTRRLGGGHPGLSTGTTSPTSAGGIHCETDRVSHFSPEVLVLLRHCAEAEGWTAGPPARTPQTCV
jgi:hypothetical protein